MMLVFGPVPSRRLGRSLGINNIPQKHCTYSCTYCQVGRTADASIRRRPFYKVRDIVREVARHLERLHEPVDYLSLVPDGEPTLEVNLGQLIDGLRRFNLPIAVISNASLVWRQDVRKELGRADWVSLKVDAVEEDVWRRINRPNRHLFAGAIRRGMREFARDFDGTLVTETMLVQGLNDTKASLEMTARFVSELRPKIAYLSIPTRPPADDSVRAPDEATVNRAYLIFSAHHSPVECLTGYEGNAFAASGDLESDLLAITAVHPLREEAVRALCLRDKAEWQQVMRMVQSGRLAVTEYEGNRFYLRKWSARSPSTGRQ